MKKIVALLLVLHATMVTEAASLLNVNADQPFISIYGVKEAEGQLDELSVQFQYGIPDITLQVPVFMEAS